ncbi:hypothetical protein D3C73_1017590 [compost metagenome]
MSDLYSFTNRKQQSKKHTSESLNTNLTFEQEVAQDITRLQNNLSKGNVEISWKEAVQTAADFYRSYPALMEYVRSSEYLLRGEADGRWKQIIKAKCTVESE